MIRDAKVRIEVALHDYEVVSLQEAGDKYCLTEDEVLAMETGKVIWREGIAIYTESKDLT